MQPFHEGRNSITYGHVDWDHNRVEQIITVNHDGVLIVEGVGLLRPELLGYLSIKVWIHSRLDEAIRRGKRRDREEYHSPNDEKWDGIWKQNDIECFEQFRPLDMADFVVDNA